jgi:hypothetical protein
MSTYHLPHPCKKCGSDMELEHYEHVVSQTSPVQSDWVWVCPNGHVEYEDYEPEYEPEPEPEL